MSKFEDVKKMLLQPTNNTNKPVMSDFMAGQLAHQICQLWEPKPNISPYALPSQAYDEYFTPPEPKPDEGRLLKDEEFKMRLREKLSVWRKEWGELKPLYLSEDCAVGDVLSLIQEHEQGVLKQVFEEIEQVFPFISQGQFAERWRTLRQKYLGKMPEEET